MATKRIRPVTSVLFTAALTTASLAASAQAAAADVEPALDEIIVTAQKRDETAQEVPISLVALSGRSIEAQGIQDIADLADSIAGLSIVSIAPGSNSFAARGITTLGGSLETNSAVGYYVDEVPVSASGQGPEFALWDVERVEVLRGPQGTLFGEGSMGGTIRVITMKPDLAEFGARVEGSLATIEDGGGSNSLRAMLNIPIVAGKFGLRLLAGAIDEDGWIDVPDLGEKDANTREQLDVRLAARWKPSDVATIDLSFMRETLETGTEYTSTSPRLMQPTDALPGAGPAGYLAPTDTTTQNANVTVSYDFAAATLVSATSYFDYKSDWIIDLTPFVPLFFGPATGGTAFNPPHADSTLWSQEIRLASSGESRLKWTVGAFYKKSERLDERGFQFNLLNAFGVPGFNLNDVSRTRDTSDSESYSLFGEIDYAFTDDWSVQIGLRYYEDDRDYRFLQLTDSLVFGAMAGTSLQASGSDSDVAPKISFSWKPNEDVHVYAKAAKGFRSGGTNGDSERSALVPADYSAEELWSYEVGAKTSLAPNVVANLGLYYNDWTNLQLPFITPDGLFPFTANAGSARALGGEFELSATLPVQGLKATVSLAYTDAEITEQVENAVGGIVARKGNRIPITPEWTSNLGLDYRRAVGGSLFAVARANWAHRSKTYSDAENTDFQINGNYDQVYASLGLAGDGWSADLFADNLFDEDSTTFKYNRVVAVPLTWTTYVRPRTLGIKFRKEF